MRNRIVSLILPFFRPELPLFVVGLMAAAVICLLIVVILWSTFLEGVPSFGTALTLNNYSDVLGYPITGQAVLNSLLLGIGTVMVSCFFALPAAWLLHRTNVPMKKFLVTLMFLHVLLPSFLTVMGWIMLLSPGIGLINRFIRIFIPFETGPLSCYNLPFMAFVQGLSLTPVLFFMLAGAFMAIDPSFEESAEVSGASIVQALQRISFRLVMPALVAGAIYIFMTAVSMFEVAALLGPPNRISVLSTLMYTALNPSQDIPNFGVAGVYGVLLLIPTLVVLHYYQKMLKLSHRYATVTGKGYRPKLTDLGRWRWGGAGFLLFFFVIDLFIPFLAVFWTSFLPRIQLPSLEALGTVSLAGYEAAILIISRSGVVTNTLQVMLVTGLATVAISLVISWIVLRTRLPLRYSLDTISMVPHAVPAIAIALSVAFVSLLFVKVIPLYGSVMAIAFAEVVCRIPFGTRTITTSLIQIHRDLDDSVYMCGGSSFTAIRRVIMPLITPALFYSFLWSMLLAYRDVTIPLFLSSPRNKIISTALWQQWQNGKTAEAAAIGVMMVVGMGLILFILIMAFPKLFGETRGGIH